MKNKITLSILLFALIFVICLLLKKEDENFGEVVEKRELTVVEKINQQKKATKGKIDLTSNIKLFWSIKSFVEKEHKIEYCESIDTKYICKIDDKVYYGSDFKMDFPKNELEKLSIYIDNKSIKLDVSQIYNPNHSGELSKNQFKIEKHKDFYLLYAFFSDGAGTYTTYWKIKDYKSKRSELSTEEKDFEWQNNN